MLCCTRILGATPSRLRVVAILRRGHGQGPPRARIERGMCFWRTATVRTRPRRRHHSIFSKRIETETKGAARASVEGMAPRRPRRHPLNVGSPCSLLLYYNKSPHRVAPWPCTVRRFRLHALSMDGGGGGTPSGVSCGRPSTYQQHDQGINCTSASATFSSTGHQDIITYLSPALDDQNADEPCVFTRSCERG